MSKLSGQVAWISGGASGMGAATARLFAAEGAAVVIADVQDEQGNELVREIERSGGQAYYSHCDVCKEKDVRNSLVAANERFGPPRSLVNCAGIVHVGLLHEYSEEDWDSLMGVNLKSVFFSLKHGLEFLRKHSRSYMVNVGSIGSFTGQALTPA